MERSGHSQPDDDNAGSFRTQHAHVPGTVKDQRHQQSAVSCLQVPCKSPLPPHQQQASPEKLQALATVYKMMLVQQDHFRIMASISGTTAAWDAIYNDHFAEKDARLKAECQRLLGLQHNNTTGSHSSPESAIHFTEQSSSDLLQAEKGRRPYPVDQESTVAQDRRSRSAEGGHPQPQLNTKADAAVETEIPEQLVSKQSPADTLSIALKSIDDVTSTVGGSQLALSRQVAQFVSLCCGITRSLTTALDNSSSITGGLKHATSFRIPTAKYGYLPRSVNTPRKPVKTTRSHRPRLRPKTRWKSTLSAAPSIAAQQILRCIVLVICVFTSVHDQQQGQRRSHLGEFHPFPVGPASSRFFNITNIVNIFKFGSPDGSASTVHSPRRSSLT